MTPHKGLFTPDEWELIYSRFLLELESDLEDLENTKPDNWSYNDHARWLAAMKGVMNKFEDLQPSGWKPKYRKIRCKRFQEVVNDMMKKHQGEGI